MNDMKKTEHFARTSDGTKIRYLIWSTGFATKRLVLVHSLAMTADFWDATAKAVGSDADLLAIDCRGHGVSDKPAGPYSVELFAAGICRATANIIAIAEDGNQQQGVVDAFSVSIDPDSAYLASVIDSSAVSTSTSGKYSFRFQIGSAGNFGAKFCGLPECGLPECGLPECRIPYIIPYIIPYTFPI